MAYAREMFLDRHDRIHYLARLFKKMRVNEETGCFEWTGRLRSGYGVMGFQGRVTGVHRVMMGCIYGLIPRRFDIDHLCRNRKCFHPDHLEVVTHLENLLRSPLSLAKKNREKTECPRGHLLDRASLKGERYCSICSGQRVHKWGVKNRERRNEISRESYVRGKEKIALARKERKEWLKINDPVEYERRRQMRYENAHRSYLKKRREKDVDSCPSPLSSVISSVLDT